ncbi:MAG: ATP-binding protein [Planctomycetota bacterium]
MTAYLANAELAPVPTPTPRDERLREVPGKAEAVIGMRRVGKSWLLRARQRELLDAGVPRSRMLHVEFEDERLADLRLEHLQLLEEAFYLRHPESHAAECWYFFDEIQNVPGWERFVRRLLSDRRLHVAITGSSAKLLSTEIATAMRGRALTIELWPFSFRETLRHRGVEVPTQWPVPATIESRLRNEFARYLEVGGFPEIQDVDGDLRRPILRDYLDVVILRDIVERHSVRNVPLLRAVVRRLIRSVGCLASVHALARDLKSQGFTFGKDAVYELMGHVEDAFLAKLLSVDTQSERRRQVNPRKVYVVDHALARAASPTAESDVGHALENIVYLELRRRGEVHGYHVSPSGREVDFVASDDQQRRTLVQVCATIEEPQTRERELTALAEAIEQTNIEQAVIVTLATAGEEQVAGHRVRVVPAWRWLLE